MPVRVLLVDDAPEPRHLLRAALHDQGIFRVVGEASDGSDAIDAAARTQPDLVVLDLGLADLEGREVLTRLRKRSPRSKVVVHPSREASAEGVDGVLPEGAGVDQLVALLAELAMTEATVTSLELAGEPASVGLARRSVRQACLELRRPDLVDKACLVVSELVSNAILHAPGGCELRLRSSGSSLRIEVLDQGDGTPDPRGPAEDGEGGRGLQIVSTLSFAWGVEAAGGDRKAVWAELV